MGCHAEGCDRILAAPTDRYYCPQCHVDYCASHVMYKTAQPVWDNPRKPRYKQRLLYFEALCPRHAAEWYPD